MITTIAIWAALVIAIVALVLGVVHAANPIPPIGSAHSGSVFSGARAMAGAA